ncbi:MAG TPA: hypothetical protein DCR48_09410 [Flavobacteriales bacterium]|nr:hypothetical protein [Flavobacteriales bacterium]
MKNVLIALVLSLSVISCVKEPVACVDGPLTTTVFETNRYSSCSENEESVEWEVQNGSFGASNYTSESFNHSWNVAGNYTIKLTSYSKSDKKSDRESVTVRVKDLCYTCIKEGYEYYEGEYVYDPVFDEYVWDPYYYYYYEPSESLQACASDGPYLTESSFQATLSAWAILGYSCSKQ